MSIEFKDLSRKLKNDHIRNKSNLVSEGIKVSKDRELLYSGFYEVGDFVMSENCQYEILDVRTNYLVLISESGSVIKRFASDISPARGIMKFPENTFKGVPLSDSYITEAANLARKKKDKYAVVKAIKYYSDGNLDEAAVIFHNMGIKLFESFDSKSLQLIAASLGIHDPSGSDSSLVADIQGKLRVLHLTNDQKEILNSTVDLIHDPAIRSKLKV